MRLDASRRRRLTRAQQWRRRRLTTLVIGSAIAVAMVAGGKAVLSDDRGPTPLEPLSSVDDGVYVVQSGDTLWTIAQRLEPEGDPRPVVRELRKRHGAAELQVGDRVEVEDLRG